MNVNEAFKIYNPKLVTIGALFLGYEKIRISGYMSVLIEKGNMYFNNSDTFKKIITGFLK